MEPKIIQYFESLLDAKDLAILKEAVHQHARYSQVHFSVVRDEDKKILIKVWQNKPHNGIAFAENRLVEITKNLFSNFTGKTVNVKPFAFVASPPDIVTTQWIQDRLTGERGEIKAIAADLGVDAATVSAYISGENKGLSGVVRAMFYYYFQGKK